MAVKISVLLVTRRTGGVDVALYSLRRQTFRDFELVFVDELYERRHAQVERYMAGCGFPFKHVNASKEHDPKWKPWDYTVARNRNLGLIHADGELATVCDDYWIYEPDFLERMWRIYEAWGKQGLSFPIMTYVTPKVGAKPGFVDYCRSRRGTWERQGGSHNLDASPDTYISIFTEDFSRSPGLVPTGFMDERCPGVKQYKEVREPRDDDLPVLRERDAGRVEGVGRLWTTGCGNCFGLTVPVGDAVSVNGWDESYDGRWGGHGEINHRMTHAFGHGYVVDPHMVVKMIGHVRYWGRDSPRTLELTNKLKIGQTKKAAARGVYRVNPGFNIAELRRARSPPP